METGSWKIDVNTSGMPQKVASAMAALETQLVGAEYKMIAYLGSQIVNGTNHAVLAEQTVLTGRDSKNIVILVFNEKPNEKEATLVSIDRILESGLPLGGTNIDVKVGEDIPEDVMEIWTDACHHLLGSRKIPVALLGTKVTNSINYIFVATVDSQLPESELELALITVNESTRRMSLVDLLADKTDHALGYAFTW